MKILHLSDTHFGKSVNGFSMIEEQSYVNDLIFELVRKENPDVILISGDVYDRTNPPVEAVKLFDDMMTEFHKMNKKVVMISGNHDSAERLSQYSEIIEADGIYNRTVFDGAPEKIVLADEFGEVNFYALPFFRISDVNRVYDQDFDDYTDAFSYLVDKMNIDTSKRNILLCHQFVAGSTLSESETSVGGVDFIAKEAFEVFDYVALGHIHRAQSFNDGRVRYCGTLLKYASNEAGHTKSITFLSIGDKKAGEKYCDIDINTVDVKPLHDMQKRVGTFGDLMNADTDENGIVTEDYVFVTLLDDNYVEDAIGSLRKLYPRIMNVEYDFRSKTSNDNVNISSAADVKEKSPEEIFGELYAMTHRDSEMNEEQKKILSDVIKDIWRDDK